MFPNRVSITFISVKKNPGIHPMGNNTDQYAKLLQQRSKKKELESIIGRDLSYFEYDMITYHITSHG